MTSPQNDPSDTSHGDDPPDESKSCCSADSWGRSIRSSSPPSSSASPSGPLPSPASAARWCAALAPARSPFSSSSSASLSARDASSVLLAASSFPSIRSSSPPSSSASPSGPLPSPASAARWCTALAPAGSGFFSWFLALLTSCCAMFWMDEISITSFSFGSLSSKVMKYIPPFLLSDWRISFFLHSAGISSPMFGRIVIQKGHVPVKEKEWIVGWGPSILHLTS
mmetsp:Transcript_43241/g.136718  ORF Transcript_43241/g.136718 Transcript_43241/m.136718 type:complete len:225 (-) Transcript_43241:81-755(-)